MGNSYKQSFIIVVFGGLQGFFKLHGEFRFGQLPFIQGIGFITTSFHYEIIAGLIVKTI